MGRPATSIIEVEQVQRVSALVGAMASCPGMPVVVTTANGKRHTGKLLSHKSGSRLSKRSKEA